MAIDTPTARAPYASQPAQSRGRLHAEPESAGRSAFRRDCDRIIHTTAFRRLGYKTQVFVYHEGDHYRTRLTHSLEVAQIARAIARALGLDEDLAEALALAHDLGHTPFGHAGERALDDCLADFGGFDHNAQTLRVVTALERRYADFDGLNLTWETREGLVKHNGPLTDRGGNPLGPDRDGGLPRTIRDHDAEQSLDLWSFASAEAQAAAIADDIAYDAHDLDDGLRAGLFALADLAVVPLLGTLVADLRGRFPDLDQGRRAAALVRELIGAMIADVCGESRQRLARLAPRSADDVRAAAGPCVGFSPAMQAADVAIKGFLYPRMYRHARVMDVMRRAEGIVRDLFARYVERPDAIPADWAPSLAGREPEERARGVADFIAGMTDRYALIEHARLFGGLADL